ncbi:hypothetical protein EVAR_37533_1 [Eumeta japonica]|uniref:Uncharacterized protein n=1 Tax=Eumeta variegata TaxID=151549 RepID=A0A4C1XQD6_EUMVA|nr:hypothetical protein EVAR_37533_1 [Eumeta japonica]
MRSSIEIPHRLWLGFRTSTDETKGRPLCPAICDSRDVVAHAPRLTIDIATVRTSVPPTSLKKFHFKITPVNLSVRYLQTTEASKETRS